LPVNTTGLPWCQAKKIAPTPKNRGVLFLVFDIRFARDFTGYDMQLPCLFYLFTTMSATARNLKHVILQAYPKAQRFRWKRAIFITFCDKMRRQSAFLPGQGCSGLSP